MKELRWGILSTGRIAATFAEALGKAESGRAQAVASREEGRAREFAGRFRIPQAFGDYQRLLDSGVDVVYIATPHPMHAEWAIRAARAGKHILCEKPLAMNLAQAQRVVAAARENDVFLMEGFMYRCHPQTERLLDMIREGAVGPIRAVEASFGYSEPSVPRQRIYDKELGGGGILDVGCYPVSMARLLAGAALGRPFAEPEELVAFGHIGEGGIDDYSDALLRFPNDITAQLSCGVRLRRDNCVRAYGDRGYLEVREPWKPDRAPGNSPAIDRYSQASESPASHRVQARKPIFAIEADHVAEHIGNRQSPAMSWNDSLGNMRALDRWRKAIGLRYPADQ